MDVSFTNVLEGARQYFQGLPSASAAGGPYYQQNVQQEQPPSQQQVNQQQHGHHQQTFFQLSNEHYADSPTASAGSSSHWLQQQSPSESSRTPTRERTPIQRPPSHSSEGSRPPSHSSQYQDVSRQYQNPYQQQIQDHQPASHAPQATFQFTRPHSRDVPANSQYQSNNQVTNSPYHHPASPQLSRPASREQLSSTMQNYQQAQPSGLRPPTPSQNQYNYQPRAYHGTGQSQSLTSKSNNSYLHSQPAQMGSQQIYYKQSTSSQIASIPVKQNIYHVENRGTEVNTQNNGQYQTPSNSEQTYRATHNLPPIAALSSYRPSKSLRDQVKSNLPRKEIPTNSYSSTSIGQSIPHSSDIHYSKARPDQYPHISNTTYGMYSNNAPNQNSQQMSRQVSTVITQSNSNVIVTASNTTHYNTQSIQNHNPSLLYQRSNLDLQNVPHSQPNHSQPNQNMNYLKPKAVDNRVNSVLNVQNTSVIKQRRESPLDLSVKTVRTSADSTEGEAARNIYSQNKYQSAASSHDYPTLDINTIERNLTQRSQATATAPRVEFHPNFKLSPRHSSWSSPKTNEDSLTKPVFQGTTVQSNPDFNKSIPYHNDSMKSRFPPNSLPNTPQYVQSNTNNLGDPSSGSRNLSQMYPYEGREVTVKRPGHVESPAIPTKIPKVESWRESINLQIEEKFMSHYKERQSQAEKQHPQIPQERIQMLTTQHKIDGPATTATLVNGTHHQTSVNNAYNYQKQAYANIGQQNQQNYNKANNSYLQSKPNQSYVPSPANHQYTTGYFNTPNKQSQHMYMNPVSRHNSNPSLVTIAKPNVATGADQRVLKLLKNSLATKEQKRIEQQKSQDILINQRTDVQHPNTDVTAPLQPKPGIDRNNVSPFTPISVPDPNICKMPPKTVPFVQETHMMRTVAVSNKTINEENTVIVNNSSNSDYDGLAAFLAARIRTKGELKEVTHSQSTNHNAARDARLQAFLEDTMKSPNRQNMNISGSSSVSSTNASPPKLLKERQSAFAPRKRLFSRNDEESVKQEGSIREKSSVRSSSETSVFDFPDSDDENEMPVLERQTLDAMRKDRRNSLKQPATPLHSTEMELKVENPEPPPSRVPSPEDDIFGSLCDMLVEQLKCKIPKRIKRTTESEMDIKLEVPEETISTDTEVKIKTEADEEPVEKQETAVSEKLNEPPEASDTFLIEDCKTPIIGSIIKTDSEMSDSEIKSGERPIARYKHRVRRKIMSSSDSSDDENKETSIKVEEREVPETEQKYSEFLVVKSEESIKNEESSKPEESVVAVKTDEMETEKNDNPKSETESPRKPNDVLPIIRPAKKPSFGDGSDFYPGWEEGVYRYKKSLRMPPSLIQLTRPPTRLSTSLPDLDPYPQSPTTSIMTDMESKYSMVEQKRTIKKPAEPIDSDSESTSSFNIFSKKTNYDSEGSSSIKSLPNTKKENRSILDRLLEKCGGRKKRKHKRKDDHSPKVIPKSENPIELLPTPTPSLAVANKTPEKSKGLNSPVINAKSAVLPFRKDTVNHFKDAFINSGNNILGVHDKFTTVVLSSRTRKETRAMKQRATIKEVFGEDRPASAPPVTCVNDVESKKEAPDFESFSKNLEEILVKKERLTDQDEEMKNSDDFTPNTSENDNKVLNQLALTTIKKEKEDHEFEDTKKIADLIVKKDPDAYSETMSLDGDETGLSGKRKSKYSKMRRKFSSGFDYIRKKKKIKKEDPDNGSVERKKKKSPPGKTPESIDDIQKEIKSWVLNKGIGESHLHRAARLGYVDITAYCLEKMDCPPNPKDNAGYTPLHEACARGHLEIAKLLLKYGANVHESAKGGIRPLHEAIENGFVEIVRLLLSYGADPYLATYAGLTPLSLASDENTKKLLKDHLSDRAGEGGPPWFFYGPASCFDPEETGYDVLTDPPQADSDQELEDIEIDMSEALLPNLYTLQGEPSTDRWVLLQDLSHFLKIKSRDALLRQISSPASSSIKVNSKNVLRELKMSDFLEQARCCQFLNMGEKINTRASKIALVKYSDRVKELLGIETAVITAR